MPSIFADNSETTVELPGGGSATVTTSLPLGSFLDMFKNVTPETMMTTDNILKVLVATVTSLTDADGTTVTNPSVDVLRRLRGDVGIVLFNAANNAIGTELKQSPFVQSSTTVSDTVAS